MIDETLVALSRQTLSSFLWFCEEEIFGHYISILGMSIAELSMQVMSRAVFQSSKRAACKTRNLTCNRPY